VTAVYWYIPDGRKIMKILLLELGFVGLTFLSSCEVYPRYTVYHSTGCLYVVWCIQNVVDHDVWRQFLVVTSFYVLAVTLSVPQTIWRRKVGWLENNELESIWNAAIMA
jgi:hypothetical protein